MLLQLILALVLLQLDVDAECPIEGELLLLLPLLVQEVEQTPDRVLELGDDVADLVVLLLGDAVEQAEHPL